MRVVLPSEEKFLWDQESSEIACLGAKCRMKMG